MNEMITGLMYILIPFALYAVYRSINPSRSIKAMVNAEARVGKAREEIKDEMEEDVEIGYRMQKAEKQVGNIITQAESEVDKLKKHSYEQERIMQKIKRLLNKERITPEEVPIQAFRIMAEEERRALNYIKYKLLENATDTSKRIEHKAHDLEKELWKSVEKLKHAETEAKSIGAESRRQKNLEKNERKIDIREVEDLKNAEQDERRVKDALQNAAIDVNEIIYINDLIVRILDKMSRNQDHKKKVYLVIRKIEVKEKLIERLKIALEVAKRYEEVVDANIKDMVENAKHESKI